MFFFILMLVSAIYLVRLKARDDTNELDIGIAGGYMKSQSNDVDEALLNFALDEIEEREKFEENSLVVDKIINVYRQVVAGFNTKVELYASVDNVQYFVMFVVYEDLHGELSLSKYTLDTVNE